MNASTADIRLWHSMTFHDADTMIAWLTAVGFTEHATFRDETDPSVVHHAEWVWESGGGVMFGSASRDGVLQNPGRSAAYLVTANPDAFLAAALAAGSTLVREVVDNDYGGRGGSVEDPEGNHWSFGSYKPS